MPEFSQSGAMTIVAHQDDDLLFMNPDILDSIHSGTANTTIYITAGDAGLADSYWQSREIGVKAAYSVMAGSDTWVDETVTIGSDETEFEIASSYLQDDPQVRLYFLRLPDGGGNLAEEDQQQLARLESGDLADVTAVDDSATYERADLVTVLSQLMELHSPTEFRLQVHEGETAFNEHSDHVHTAEFTEEALEIYSGDGATVTHYVHYDSQFLPVNLTPEQAASALEVMQAYAAHDPGTQDASGNLLQIYSEWTARQYIDDQYELLPGEGDSEETLPDWPGPGDWTYSLAGPDAFLFDIGSATGAIAPKGWFTPLLNDAWDQDEDHSYEVTRIATPADNGPGLAQDLTYQTTHEGVLTLTHVAADTIVHEGGEDTDPDTDGEETNPGTDGEDTNPGTDGEDTTPSTGGEDTTPGTDGENTPDLTDATFSLAGTDAFLFVIDPETGAISPQGWFTPSLDDAWDSDEDHFHELTRITSFADGSDPVEQTLRLQTVGEGLLEHYGDTDGSEGTAPHSPPAEDPPTEDTPPDEPGIDTPPPSPDTGGPPTPTTSGVYGLAGPDSQLFVIDPDSGEIALQGWFNPTYDDAWDRDENHLYEITRTLTPDDGTAPTSEDLFFETLPDGSFVPVLSGADLLEMLALDGASTEDIAALDDGALMDAEMDIAV